MKDEECQEIEYGTQKIYSRIDSKVAISTVKTYFRITVDSSLKMSLNYLAVSKKCR